MPIDLIALLISYPLKTFQGITSPIFITFYKRSSSYPLYFHRPKFSLTERHGGRWSDWVFRFYL